MVLVGPIGSGKSTWAQGHFSSNEIVSLANLRSAVGENEYDRRATVVAYELLERIVDARLERGLSVVIDSDGLDDGRRSRWLAAAQANSISARAVLFTTDVEMCLANDVGRPNPQPTTIIKRQAARCNEIRPTLEREGFDVHEVSIQRTMPEH